MIVQIESNVYNTDRYFDVLDQLIPIFQSGKHSWDIRNPDELQASSWLKIEEVGKRQKKRVDNLIKESVHGLYISKKERKAKITLTITTEKERKLVYQPKKALLMMSDAAYIIVENSNSDKTFIEVIAKAYKREEITKAIDNEWLKFDTEGGKGGIPRRIDFHFQKSYSPRLLMLVDSDKEFPDDKHKVEKLVTIANEKDIKHHVLLKRAIENYIPIEAFPIEHSILNEIIRVYTHLEEEQKDYFDLKKGFKSKGKLPDTQKELFNQINSKHPIFKALRKGFGIRGFNPNNLYLFFQSAKTTKKTLQNRCKNAPNELEDILNKISNLL